MTKLAYNPVFCAIDTADFSLARDLALALRGYVGGLKIGLEFFMAHGAAGYMHLADLGMPMFLDVKLHDIPNTVKGALTSLLRLRPDFVTIHTSGGEAMMRAAVDAASTVGSAKPLLLGVTVLTSLDTVDLLAMGQEPNVSAQVLRLAHLAASGGMDGVICSPAEVMMLREACGKDFILMVPGVRPAWAQVNDQKRVMSPRDAMEAGANYLVIGRPITSASDPAAAARKVVQEIEEIG